MKYFNGLDITLSHTIIARFSQEDELCSRIFAKAHRYLTVKIGIVKVFTCNTVIGNKLVPILNYSEYTGLTANTCQR